MKTLLMILSVLISQSVFATGIVPIKKGDMNLSQAKGEIISVRQLCPVIPGRSTCMSFGSVIDIEVKLKGCMDRLGGYFTKFQVVDGKGILYFGAVNINNEVSRRAMCVKAPAELISVQVPFEGEIEIVNLSYTATGL